MRRNALLVGGWVVATVLALALGLLGVRAVSDSVTSSRPASLSPDAVKAALARSDASVTSSSSSSDASSSSASSSVDTRSNDSSESTSSSSSETDSSSSDDGVGGETAVPPEDRTYQLVGGSVGVRFENGEAHLLWAQPNAGYSVQTSGSSSNVDVRFEQIDGDHESRLKAFWSNGPQQEIEEKD